MRLYEKAGFVKAAQEDGYFIMKKDLADDADRRDK
jgi:ribosomal protein S18 acetylase RimI-like enzyme